MRQNLGFIVTVVLLIGLLIAINSATYVTQREQRDSEITPNRSSYHSGPTGTRALYDLLSESGFSVMRWRDSPQKLLSDSARVNTFVVVGNTRLPFEEEQTDSILLWVQRGGRLVVVDRSPESALLPATEGWRIGTQLQNMPPFDIDPGSVDQMTDKVVPVDPVQPTPFTRNVLKVMPSQFFATVHVSAVPRQDDEHGTSDEEGEYLEPAVDEESAEGEPTSPAPVVHLSNAKGPLLVDYALGHGRIVVLTDPYIISNGGIGLVDNVHLAINLIGSDGLIAFDEFHQGRGFTSNPIIAYFEGTPVLAVFGQIALLVLVVVWTKGRRFARPLPLPRVDRRSSLEFVASMAELQQRTGAFDLAIENVYTRIRRVLARQAGVDYNSSRAEIASRLSIRSNIDAKKLETLMRQCEEAINGEPLNERQAVQLVRRLREVERALGLRLRSRDTKQLGERVTV
ncbi:MAG TPA: DUF4350 domain-containing protein [Pyrinomonadaceae bacterium]|nr:DUF4350 domain-containing protein [Pyrinomonadaceae bacterium]